MALGTAPSSYPSYAYNSTQLTQQIVLNASAWNALPGPGTWQAYPYVGISGIPTDPGLTDTDIRLYQLVVESRVQSQLLQIGLGIVDDPVTQLRPDVVANDSSLTS